MKLLLDIEVDDGTRTQVPVLPRTQVAFERHFSTPDHPVRLSSDVSMEHLYWLAWHASKQTAEFDVWLDTVVEVGAIVNDDDEVDGPLDTAQPSGTSLPSPSNPVQG